MLDKYKLSEIIKSEAVSIGFLSCGISKAEFLSEEAPKLESWLKSGFNGEMSYMERNFDKRLDKTSYVLTYPARPLVDTRVMSLLQLNKIPSGTPIIVAMFRLMAPIIICHDNYYIVMSAQTIQKVCTLAPSRTDAICLT
mgnify:CR=1 FL=1